MLINMPEAHKRKRIDNMNVVDHLLEHRFETLSLEEKLEVKRLMSCALQSIYVFPVLYVPFPLLACALSWWRVGFKPRQAILNLFFHSYFL